MTEREAPAKLEDQPDTLAMIEKAFGRTRDILMNGTTMRYLSDHIEELIAARVAVAWQASRQQALEEEPNAEIVKAMVLAWLSQPAGRPWEDCAVAAWRAGTRALVAPIGDKA